MNKDDLCYFVLLRDKINSTLLMGVAFSLVFMVKTPVLVENDLRPGREMGTVS